MIGDVQLHFPVSPMKATLPGTVKLIMPAQFRKALFPMLVTLLGIVTPARPEQP